MKKREVCAILVTITLLTVASCSVSNTYCVGEQDSCSNANVECQLCHSLMWFVNRTQSISNNSLILFLPGNHNLSSNGTLNAVLNISNAVNVTLQGTLNTVICTGNQTGFLIQNSSNIAINSLAYMTDVVQL